MTGDEDQISSCPPPSSPLPSENLVLTREVQVSIKRGEVKRDNVSGINWAENARRVKMADNLFCLAVVKWFGFDQKVSPTYAWICDYSNDDA